MFFYRLNSTGAFLVSNQPLQNQDLATTVGQTEGPHNLNKKELLLRFCLLEIGINVEKNRSFEG